MFSVPEEVSITPCTYTRTPLISRLIKFKNLSMPFGEEMWRRYVLHGETGWVCVILMDSWMDKLCSLVLDGKLGQTV